MGCIHKPLVEKPLAPNAADRLRAATGGDHDAAVGPAKPRSMDECQAIGDPVERLAATVDYVGDLCDREPDVLADAARVTAGDRQADYGSPAENHGRTAAMATPYLRGRLLAMARSMHPGGVPDNLAAFIDAVAFTGRDVCLLNIIQKASREAHAPKHDSLVDIAGYASNAAHCGSESSASADEGGNGSATGSPSLPDCSPRSGGALGSARTEGGDSC